MAVVAEKTSKAMRETIEQIKGLIDYRLSRYDAGKGRKEDETEFNFENEVDKISELQNIANGIIMVAEHVRDKMPSMNFLNVDGEIYEEKTYAKKVKTDYKKEHKND